MKVTNELVYKILNWLNIEKQVNDEDKIILKTVCHGGNSNKLYFYKNSNNFNCYTHCHLMDVFDLISKVKDISKKEAFKIVASNFKYTSSNTVSKVINPASKFIHIKDKDDKPLEVLSESLLNNFYDYRIEKWNKENIKYPTQKKFEIKYSVENNAIIIPHRDLQGNLVGIRQRNLDKSLVDNGMKYVPTVINGIRMNYPTSQNLYGYYYNKQEIKLTKKIILFEAEKSVMQMDSFYPNSNFSVALSGNSLSKAQIKFISSLPIDEVILGFDKDYHNGDIKSMNTLKTMLIKKYKKLTGRFSVSVLWDEYSLLDYKSSPTDKGKKVFSELMKRRKFL